MTTTGGTSTTSSPPVTLQATTATTTSTTASVASPAKVAFPIQGIHPPGHLGVKENIAENWKTFKQAWNNYAIIMNVRQQPETCQVALFLHCIGPEALNIFNGMSFDNVKKGRSWRTSRRNSTSSQLAKQTKHTNAMCSTVRINHPTKPLMRTWLCCVLFHRHATSVNASENCLSTT